MSDVKDFLAGHLRGKPAPFLFVGSGLTRRYTKAEDWEGLLRVFADRTDRPYEYYKTSANGDLPKVASKIAEPFHDLWWSKEEYQESRERWSSTIRDNESALRVEVAKHVADAADRLPTRGALAKELNLLRAAVVDGIITTNFDPVLESLFPELRVFVGQDEMLFANPQGSVRSTRSTAATRSQTALSSQPPTTNASMNATRTSQPSCSRSSSSTR